MTTNKKLLILFLIINLFSCKSIKESKCRFLILEKKEIENYYVYKVKELKDDKTKILLSLKNNNCFIYKKNEIKENNLYNFKIEEQSYIFTKEGISISLVGGLTVDNIKLSDNKNLPFIILNSCNGFVK